MKIKLKNITIRDVAKGYVNDAEEGVTGYNSNLNIRPKYQREFVYKDKQRDAVLDTVRKDFPLNVLYFADNGDGTFEVMDGQQRIISICEYIEGNFAINHQFFTNLSEEAQKQILDYKLSVYFCTGTDDAKLDWFRTINIAGEKLMAQELRNAIYTGPWLTNAKKYFSKTGCPASDRGKDYLRGSSIRQDYLETVLKWISDGEIENYMAKKQKGKTAKALWVYFEQVIEWVEAVFPNYRKEMKGVDWGTLYNANKSKKFDAKKLEKRVAELMQDEDVTKKSGIYPFLINGEEKSLSIRSFTANQKREAYEAQKGICPVDGEEYDIDEMEADHITPWSQGGKTIASNCQMLSKKANREKSDK